MEGRICKKSVMEERRRRRNGAGREGRKDYRYLGGGKTWKWPEDARASAGATGQHSADTVRHSATALERCAEIRPGAVIMDKSVEREEKLRRS